MIDKICPFMNRENDFQNEKTVMCFKESCMAWGVIDTEIVDIDCETRKLYGCKLIEREV